MTQPQNDRYIINLILAMLFIFGIGVSIYFIYSLPVHLRLATGYQPEFIKVYVALIVTFGLGMLSILLGLQYKKEVLVFRDKIIDVAQAQRESAEQAGRSTISLDAVQNALENTNRKEALHDCLQAICKQLEAGQGAFYELVMEDEKRWLELRTGYALNIGESAVVRFEFGEGLVGQVGSTGQPLFVDDIPEGYITILSGLGSASPKYVILAPIKSNEKVSGVLEIASFTRTTDDQRKFVEEAARLMGDKLSTQA